MLKSSIISIAALALLWTPPASAQGVLGIGTSPQGTMGYTLGAAFAKAYQESTKIQARVQPGSGTTVVLPLVNSGELDMGFCNSLELAEAYAGKGVFANRPQKNIRTLGVLFPIQSGFFVRKDSPIKSMKDIRGKSIAYGYTSQAILKTVVDGVLANAGLTAADMKTVLVPNIVRGVDEFTSGKVDLGYFAVGSAKVSEADAAVGGIRYLPLDDSPAAVAAMRKFVPTAYIAVLQPAPNRVGVAKPMKLMYYDYTAFTNSSVSKKRAYELTKTIVEKRDAMSATQKLFKLMEPARVYRDIPVPYAEGSLAYFKDHHLAKTE
jgi:TRAP transporter TAXI family solute receptor